MHLKHTYEEYTLLKAAALATGGEPAPSRAWPVDGRINRFDPPLPANYFGNVVLYGHTEARMGDLIEHPYLGPDCRPDPERHAPVHGRVPAVGGRTAGRTKVSGPRSPKLSDELKIGRGRLVGLQSKRDRLWRGRPVYFTRIFSNAFTSCATLLPHPAALAP